MSRGVIPSDDAFRRFSRATKHFEQTYINPGKRGEKVVRVRGRDGKHEGYLCEDLDAATDTLTGPTTASATMLVKGSDGNLTHGPHVTITNRDTTLTLEAWTYIIWETINGEKRIIWAACAGEVSSSCDSSGE